MYLAEGLTVAATITNECGSTASATCTTNFTVVKVDVAIGGVGEDKEETEGAFVQFVPDAPGGQWTPEGTNALGGFKHPGGDYLQAGVGQVANEDDLMPLTMSVSPCPDIGAIALRVGNGKAKIWKSSGKGSTNLIVAAGGEKRWSLSDSVQRQEFNAPCSSLFVEGVGKGEINITLSYEAPSMGSDCLDTVKYTSIT